MKNNPRSEMDGAMIATCLLATVVEAWRETQPIKNTMMIGESTAVLGVRCSNSASFSEWYCNQIAETW